LISQFRSGEEFVESTRDVSVATGANRILEYTRHEPIPGLMTLSGRAVDRDQ
jgi:hypothetical protein